MYCIIKGYYFGQKVKAAIARIVYYLYFLSNRVGLVSSLGCLFSGQYLSLTFESTFINNLAKQVRVRIRSSQFY